MVVYEKVEVNTKYKYAKIVWSDGCKTIVSIDCARRIVEKFNVPMRFTPGETS